MTYQSSNPKPYDVIQKFVFKLKNKLLKKFDSEEMGNGKMADFSKGRNGGRITGFFTETISLGMIEEKNYKNFDLVAPFLKKNC